MKLDIAQQGEEQIEIVIIEDELEVILAKDITQDENVVVEPEKMSTLIKLERKKENPQSKSRYQTLMDPTPMIVQVKGYPKIDTHVRS